MKRLPQKGTSKRIAGQRITAGIRDPSRGGLPEHFCSTMIAACNVFFVKRGMEPNYDFKYGNNKDAMRP